MKKLRLLVLPLMVSSVIFSCNNNKLQISYQNASKEGKAYIELVKEKGIKKGMQEGETFVQRWNSALMRLDDFLKQNFEEELAAVLDREIANSIKKFSEITIEGDPFETYYFQLNEDYDRVIFYIHGGAYFNSIKVAHIVTCYELAKLFNAKVYIPIYPLIPDYFWSICYDFLNEIYSDIVEIEKDKEVIFAGDSAGGGLVLAYSQYLEKEKTNLKLPSSRICFSPWCDVTLTNPDAIKKEEDDIFLSVFGLRKFGNAWSYYYTSPYDYKISPFYGELNDKIPTIVFSGSEEIFLPDIKLTCEKLHKNGARTKLVIGKGLFHVYPICHLPESLEALQIAHDFVINGK